MVSRSEWARARVGNLTEQSSIQSTLVAPILAMGQDVTAMPVMLIL